MLNNVKFQGEIGGKKLKNYKCKIDWDIKDVDKRLELIKEIFNLDEIGSNEEFWQEIWDCGICKANLNVIDIRWEETNIAHFLETVGSYFIYGYDKKKKKKYNEVELKENITIEEITNDKNYRLAPPEEIKQSDYKVRDLFNGTYEEYVEKVSRTPYEIKEKESWERIKHNEEEKVRLLLDARHNLKILKSQMEEMKKNGSLNYREIKAKKPNMNVELRLSEQMRRYGLNNKDVLRIEEDIYFDINKDTNVLLWHLTDNLKSMKDYMISCKLAYTNRVKINPPKCPIVRNAIEHVDYLEAKHLRAILLLGEMDLDPANDLAILTHDINKKANDMHKSGKLSDRDMYIIEGFKHKVPLEIIGNELGVSYDTIDKTINRICNNMVKSFYEDMIDLHFLNVSYGKYKTCNKCKETKLTNKFDKNGKRGLMPMCKECRKK